MNLYMECIRDRVGNWCRISTGVMRDGGKEDRKWVDIGAWVKKGVTIIDWRWITAHLPLP